MANITGVVQVVDNHGKVVDVAVTIQESLLKELYNFQQMLKNRVEAFEYSFDHALEYIAKRGKAEIERSQKNKDKRAEMDLGIKDLKALTGTSNIAELVARIKELKDLQELAALREEK